MHVAVLLLADLEAAARREQRAVTPQARGVAAVEGVDAERDRGGHAALVGDAEQVSRPLAGQPRQQRA